MTPEPIPGFRFTLVKAGDDRRGLRSGELAREAGVSADTLRHYERRGLLARPRRLANGYRLYPESAVARVRLVQKGLALGLSLDELVAVLRDRDAGRPPCERVRAAAGRTLDEVDRQIGELERFRKELSGILAEWDARRASGTGAALRLLESVEIVPRTGAAVAAAARFAKHGRRRKT